VKSATGGGEGGGDEWATAWHGCGHGSRQEAAVAAASTTVVTTVSAVPPAPVPTTGDRAVMVKIPDDDAPPPGWGQWENWPTPAPEPAAGC
jgi:hypothetical protein